MSEERLRAFGAGVVCLGMASVVHAVTYGEPAGEAAPTVRIVSPAGGAAAREAPAATEVSVGASPVQGSDTVGGRWTLTKGHLISHDLAQWAKAGNWNLVWNLTRDWIVPADTSFTGDSTLVAQEVVKTLAANGVVIRAVYYAGNRTLVVSGAGVQEQ